MGLAEFVIGSMHGYCLRMRQDHLLKYLKFSVLTDVRTTLFIDSGSEHLGLVSTHVLMLDGMDTDEAIGSLRAGCTPAVLSNAHFQRRLSEPVSAEVRGRRVARRDGPQRQLQWQPEGETGGRQRGSDGF